MSATRQQRGTSARRWGQVAAGAALALAAMTTAAMGGPPDGGAPRRVDLFPSSIAPPSAKGDQGKAATPTALVVDPRARERVRSGQVPPDWRGTERTLSSSFRPTIAMVATGSAPRALVSQALRNEATGPARTRNEPVPTVSAEPDHKVGEIELADQVEAAQQAMRRGRDWKEVEVEVELTDAGTMASSRVTLSSGSASFDRAALEAVAESLRRSPVATHQDLRLARFRLSAARAVTPLDVSPVTSPQGRARTRGLVPKVRIQFDEVSGKVEAEKPYSQSVQTDVRLYSLSPIGGQ